MWWKEKTYIQHITTIAMTTTMTTT
jgi:hypothetical protein